MAADDGRFEQREVRAYLHTVHDPRDPERAGVGGGGWAQGAEADVAAGSSGTRFEATCVRPVTQVGERGEWWSGALARQRGRAQRKEWSACDGE